MVSAKTPEGLPPGWKELVKVSNGRKIKVYIEKSSGCKFYSKPQVIRHLQTVDLNKAAGIPEKLINNADEKVASQHSEQTESERPIAGADEGDMGKPSLKKTHDVVLSNGELDDLPLGWIKEIKIRNSSNGTRRDPYYIEPENGYSFRSKKDAFRYLETGDIRSCTMRPQKRDKNELKMLKDAVYSASPPNGNTPALSQTRKLFFAGDKSQDGNSSYTSTIALAENECLREQEGKRIVIDVKVTTPMVAVEDLCSKAVTSDIAGDRSEAKADRCRQDARAVNHNGAVSSTASAGLHEQKRPESRLNTETGLRKSRKRKTGGMPARSSKRLAGNEPDMLPDLQLSERALRAAAKKLVGPIGADGSASLNPNVYDPEKVPPQIDTKGGIEAATGPTSFGSETPLAIYPQNNHMIPSGNEVAANPASFGSETPLPIDPENNHMIPSDDQVVHQQIVEFANERQDEPRLQGDYWSDPCFDFAFKTLIGAIPVEDSLALQGCFQQHIDSSYTQHDLSFGQPGLDIPTFQNDMLNHVDSVQNIVPPDQLPTNLTFPPPGNISLPSCSGLSSQPPSLDGRSKDHKAKVNS